MPYDDIFVGTVGLEITVRTGIDLTDTASTKLRVKSPSGTCSEWDCIVTDAVNGRMNHTTVESDFDESGVWTMQSYITMLDGSKLYGSDVRLLVKDQICITS